MPHRKKHEDGGPLIRSQTSEGDTWRYKGTKESGGGESQSEYENANYPGKDESLYVERPTGEKGTARADEAYKGQPGGWAGMNFYHEDDGK